jgi:hypothetical protein
MKHGGHHNGQSGEEWELLFLTVGCPGQTVDLNVAYLGGQALDDAVIDRRVNGGAWETDWSITSLPIVSVDNGLQIDDSVEYRVAGRIAEVRVTSEPVYGPIVNAEC